MIALLQLQETVDERRRRVQPRGAHAELQEAIRFARATQPEIISFSQGGHTSQLNVESSLSSPVRTTISPALL